MSLTLFLSLRTRFTCLSGLFPCHWLAPLSAGRQNMSSPLPMRVLCMSFFCRILGSLLLLAHHTLAVTVYPTNGAPPTTTLAPGVSYSGPAAFDPVTLNVPAVPTQFPTKYNIQIANGAAPAGASIPLLSSFFGFSIEMSVVDQVCQ